MQYSDGKNIYYDMKNLELKTIILELLAINKLFKQ